MSFHILGWWRTKGDRDNDDKDKEYGDNGDKDDTEEED